MDQSIDELLTKEPDRFRVAIFGSSHIKEGDVFYEDVQQIAEELGKRAIDVVTGGGPGLMEAASKGHRLGDKEDKAKTIGIGIELPWRQRFNKDVEYKEEVHVFSKRLDDFMLLSNVVVVAPGGLGTMLELFYTWQLVQVHHICNIPIILVGEMWGGLLEWIKKEPLSRKYLTEEDFEMVFHAKNKEEVLEIVDFAHQEFQKNNPNICLNYKKYKIK